MPKPQIDETEAARLACELLPTAGPPRSMTEGLHSRAFALDDGAQSYVLRLAGDPTGFAKDAYAAAHFASAALPIPDVVATGAFGEYAYCLTRRLPGRPVNSVSAPILGAVTRALADTAEVLWACNVSDSSGFGFFGAAGNGGHPSWRDYLLDQQVLAVIDARGVVAPALVDGLAAFVAARADDCPQVRHLLHGDFGSANVLTDGRRITGVLDWELAGYGDPMHDVAEMLVWDGGEPCMSALVGWFRATLPEDPALWRRIECYRARQCLTELAYADAGTVAWVQRLASTIVGR